MAAIFHRVKAIEPMPDMQLRILLAGETTEICDAKPLESRFSAFRKLEDRSLFDEVSVGEGGYGAVWDDETDISSEELWEHGMTAEMPESS